MRFTSTVTWNPFPQIQPSDRFELRQYLVVTDSKVTVLVWDEDDERWLRAVEGRLVVEGVMWWAELPFGPSEDAE